MSRLNRRKFIKTASKGASAAILPAGIGLACRAGNGSAAAQGDSNFVPHLEINLTAKPSDVQILDGASTAVWQYGGEVIKGDPSALVNVANTYLGPILKTRRGQNVRIRFHNLVDQESIIHWHGLHVPPEMDGHPRHVITEGETYVYEFQVVNRPGTYWFHPHPHRITGPQVYRGLAGLFLISEKNEEQLDLPSGDYDIPLVIQDRLFDANNQLVYVGNTMEQMLGFLGDTILINGKTNQVMNVESRAYRFRILNGSNSRIYKLAWQDGTPMTIVGTDGGLLQEPVTRPYLTLGPAERFDVIADFSGREVGDELRLVSESIPGIQVAMGGMMGRMMGGMGQRASVPENGARLDILTIRINQKVERSFVLPKRLSDIEFQSKDSAVNRNNPRQFEFAMTGHMQWTINGRTFEMTDVADDERVKLNTTEIWEFINSGGGMGMMGGMMHMPHPVHIHGLQFQIVDRQIDPQFAEAWEALQDGVVDDGWKDSFLLLPGARVKVLLTFKDFKGMYLYHCHNLEHEDMGMMRNYLIES